MGKAPVVGYGCPAAATGGVIGVGKMPSFEAGTSDSISGINVVVGAPRNGTNGSFSGQAHLFTIVLEPSTAMLLLMGFAASFLGWRNRGV